MSKRAKTFTNEKMVDGKDAIFVDMTLQVNLNGVMCTERLTAKLNKNFWKKRILLYNTPPQRRNNQPHILNYSMLG